MEDLDEKSCGCCNECNCGEDCNCTPENKCCKQCTCGEHECKCNENCSCEAGCECEGENKCCESCDCEKDYEGKEQCGCSEECDCEKESEDKCKCGCGEELGEEENVSNAYFSQLLSLKAEFDNYRKRTQNDITKAYSNGFNEAITEFLPALDSFKMACEYITDPNTLMGIQYIEKGILSTLEKMGVTVIDVSGKFDPELHQAIGSEVSLEHESGDIIKECFKGFKLGDKVIRYSQVIVAK